MATTKKVFEDILEVQQKMIDWWEGTSSKMMNAMMESTTEDFSEIKSEAIKKIGQRLLNCMESIWRCKWNI